MNEGTRDEIRSTVEALRGERFDGRSDVERELLDRGAPIVAELLDLAADEGALPDIFKDWFKEIGGAADELLRVRRDGPGRLRRYALEALASLGAAHRLDPRDRAAVERLVRLRLSDAGDGEPRRPRYWPGFWVTVRGDDLKAITAELGLHHLTRATVPMGVHAAVMEEHFITMTDAAGKPQYATPTTTTRTTVTTASGTSPATAAATAGRSPSRMRRTRRWTPTPPPRT
ncbi:hypothetical protein GCM10009850_074690 [Nonomuraea monospora]|uniref:Uncharacterized protein n=1 Tax=Nonomuraea monospora TaxID=568818 RepID=A0ABP5PME2_9ACTN